jgi:hypothetical protein
MKSILKLIGLIVSGEEIYALYKIFLTIFFNKIEDFLTYAL